jgi:hypothetical protein
LTCRTPDLLNGDLSRLYRDVPIATAPQFRTGQVFRPGTLQRNAAGQVTGGDPYPGNIVPRSEWSRNAPAFLKVINFLPVSGGAPLATNPELVRVPYQDTYRFNKNQYVARVDYSINEKMNVFYRWVWDPAAGNAAARYLHHAPEPPSSPCTARSRVRATA